MSEIDTRCVPTAVLPQLSVAIHVLIITLLAAHPSAELPSSFTSVKVISTSESQLSVAVTPVEGLPAPSAQSPSTSAGMPLNTGGVESSTTIICC